jgi:hypothetical protein
MKAVIRKSSGNNEGRVHHGACTPSDRCMASVTEATVGSLDYENSSSLVVAAVNAISVESGHQHRYLLSRTGD